MTKEEKREYYKQYRLENKDKAKAYRSENKQKIKERRKAYRLDNKEKIREYNKEYRKNNLEKVRQEGRKMAQRRRESSKHRIHASFSSGVWKSIKDKSKSKSFDLVGYSLGDLMARLESQFKPGMSWENYGRGWHIDHVKPMSWFNFKSKHDAEFKACWALDNLQPLWAFDNISKGNRFEG
jgi:excinuclease UvrABC ATPase subunit